MPRPRPIGCGRLSGAAPASGFGKIRAAMRDEGNRVGATSAYKYTFDHQFSSRA